MGSGQGSVPLARSFAEDGRNVVLFERAKFGGTCAENLPILAQKFTE